MKKDKRELRDICRTCEHRNKTMPSYIHDTKVFCRQWQEWKSYWDTCTKYKFNTEDIDELYLPNRLVD